MARPQRIHVFWSVIARETLQPAYRVVPNVNRAGTDCKSFRSNIFRDDGALRFREPVKRAAARVVGVRPRALNDDAIDAGRELRRSVAVEAEADEAAEKTAG